MNKLKISLLKQARKSILSKKEQFICIALDEAANKSSNVQAYKAAKSLQAYIHKAMTGSYTLESWILYTAKHLGKKRDRLLLITDEFMLNARVQWIDWIIEQLKEPK